MRNGAIDYLKLTMAFFIVMLHGGFLADFYPDYAYLWIQGLFRLCVPLFFLIAGFFFWKSGIYQFDKYIKRLLVLYAAWMLIYIPFWWDWNSADHTHNFLLIIKKLLVGYFHLWFVPALIGAACIVKLCERFGKIHLLFVSAPFLYLTGVLLQYVANANFGFTLEYQRVLDSPLATRNLPFFALPYFALGCWIAHHPLKNPSIKLLSLGSIAGIILLLGELWLANLMFPGNGWALLLFLYPVSWIIMYWTLNLPPISSFNTGAWANGIYFVHPLFFALTWGLNLSETIATISTAAMSLSCAALIYKFRFTRRILL